MKTYSVEVEVSWIGNTEVTYIIVEANNQTEAHQKALQMVNRTLDVRAEVRPLELDDITEAMGLDPLPPLPTVSHTDTYTDK